MLWILRAPLMVRTALLALLLLPFLASSARAAGVDTVRDSVHSAARKSSVHRRHYAAHHASNAARTSVRTTRAGRTRRTATSTRRHSKRSYTAKRASSVSHRSTLRRARYTHHARAHFVPIGAALPRSAASRSRERFDAYAAPSEAAANPIDESAAANDPEPRNSESDFAQAPVQVDAEAVPATADSAPAETGNSLAAPPPAEQPAGPAEGQVAELRVPRVYGRYALRGTRDSLVRQNERADEESLERIEDDADLQDRIARGLLVHVPESTGLLVNPALPEDRRYCRPWTADFLADLSRAHEAQFHKPLIVSSAVRTVEYQKRLMRINHNAADAEGDIVSPHLTGATIDIAKSGLSRREMQWMRDHLFAYQTAGVIDVEEEFRQRCFHITVYKNYAPASSVGRPHHAEVPQTVPPDRSTATIPDDSGTREK